MSARRREDEYAVTYIAKCGPFSRLAGVRPCWTPLFPNVSAVIPNGSSRKQPQIEANQVLLIAADCRNVRFEAYCWSRSNAVGSVLRTPSWNQATKKAATLLVAPHLRDILLIRQSLRQQSGTRQCPSGYAHGPR